jgi:dTDP-4-dehydrorhamnose reductase
MKVLVLGSYGQLGRELTRRAWPSGTEIIGLDRDTDDISQPGVADKLFGAYAPSVVVNAAAYTAVDRAEIERDEAYAGNVRAPQFLAEACARHRTPLIHVSTDYVFDGAKPTPYEESDATMPISVYGRTKCEGEEAVRATLDKHLILRTAWLYSPFGNNFAKTMLRLGAERAEMRVVNDQHGSPTSAGDLAGCIAKLLPSTADGTARYGTYHVTNAGATTWYGFAQAIFHDLHRRTGRRVVLGAIATSEYPTPARRPANSRLDCGLLARNFGLTMRPWQAALGDVLDELHAGKAAFS